MFKKYLYLFIIMGLSIQSCSKNEADLQTLHFTTKDGVKTTLDLDIEFYRVDDKPGIYYINYQYYKRNNQKAWMISSKADGPWRVFPEQSMIPYGLAYIKS